MSLTPQQGYFYRKVKHLGQTAGWSVTEHNTIDFALTFWRGEEMIKVWYVTMTVLTSLKHPNKPDPTEMYRNRVRLDFLEEIFKNPRVHTNPKFDPRDRESKQWTP